MLETAFDAPPYVVSYGGWGRAGVLIDGPRLRSLPARPDLNRPYARSRGGEALSLEEDPNAILLPMVGRGLLGADNPAGRRS